MRVHFAVLVGSSLLIGCSNGLNSDCEWPQEVASVLRIHDKLDAEHLLRDVELAEELSIRFGDERWPQVRRDSADAMSNASLLSFSTSRTHTALALQDVLSARERRSRIEPWDECAGKENVLFLARGLTRPAVDDCRED